MPMYDYKCQECGLEFEHFTCIIDRHKVQCKCGGRAELQISTKARDWFRPFSTDDFNGRPIMVESKKHLKQLCKEHGVTSHAL